MSHDLSEWNEHSSGTGHAYGSSAGYDLYWRVLPPAETVDWDEETDWRSNNVTIEVLKHWSGDERRDERIELAPNVDYWDDDGELANGIYYCTFTRRDRSDLGSLVGQLPLPTRQRRLAS